MKIGMIFPGYGSQFVGMAKELYDESRLLQEYFEEASNCLNINFVKLCFASSDAELSKIEHAYVALFLTSVALAQLLKQEGINPDVVAGYGIGELSAIATAGGISFPDGLYFLYKYAQFYNELLQKLEMQAIQVAGLPIATVKRIINQLDQDQLSLTEYLDEQTGIVVGLSPVIDQFEQQIQEFGAQTKQVAIGRGLHSSLMKKVVEQLHVYSEKVDFKNLSIPLIASVDAKEVQKSEVIKKRILKQLEQSILWHKVLDKIVDWDLIIELGPGTNLSSLIAKKYPNKLIISINKRSDIEKLQSYIQDLKGIPHVQRTEQEL